MSFFSPQISASPRRARDLVRMRPHTPGSRVVAQIAACGPLGIKTTLASAHLAIDSSQAEAMSQLNAQYGALYGTEDFKEGRAAEAEGRQPIYQGR